ncbi:hypothetical protein EWM62_04995 [Mucilaginibacter terrigena]|uniref:DUF1349 domain-containing protein n=1 Tax=Mucilaginibacter terrigena TaxID=2492395 RepID=A0A4Q5LPF4_9SPHI|nr:hypothetical protein [Mucilaginibacter terrigena]RYU91298.1 hypothetical protein EWM62_04995 [Mucilaginibacter terrigena]
MKNLVTAFLLFVSSACFAQTGALGIFDGHKDVGNPKLAGSSTYNKATKTYTLRGAGYNIWFARDEFQYLYKNIKGDFTVTANFAFVGDKGNNHRKIGWMIRQSTDEKSIHLSAVQHGDGLAAMQWRVNTGEDMKDPEGEIFFPEKKVFGVIQLKRVGKKLIMSVGDAGGPLKVVGEHTMDNMPDEALVGLFICSHDPDSIEEAKVWNVDISK